MDADFQDELVRHYCERLQQDHPDTVVWEAIQDPQLFVFGELLDDERTSNLREDLRELLSIMAFGEINNLPENLPSVVISKMKILTVLSHIDDTGWLGLRFDDLQQRLGLSSESDLELIQILLKVNRSRVAHLRIDERTRTVDVIDIFVGRDIRPSELEAIFQELKGLEDRATYFVDNTNEFLATTPVMDLVNLLRSQKPPPTPPPERESKRGRISASD